jgi:hypothetical protein
MVCRQDECLAFPLHGSTLEINNQCPSKLRDISFPVVMKLTFILCLFSSLSFFFNYSFDLCGSMGV